MLEYLDYDHLWKEKEDTDFFNVSKGTYLDEEYYIVEEKGDRNEYYEKSVVHFVPCTTYDKSKDLISELKEQEDLEFFLLDKSDFSMMCLSIIKGHFLNEKHKKIQIIFEEYAVDEEIIIRVKPKKSNSYKVYIIHQEMLFDYEIEELNEILLEEYDIDLFFYQEMRDEEIIMNLLVVGCFLYWGHQLDMF